MRSLLLSFTLLVAAGDRTSDRDALVDAGVRGRVGRRPAWLHVRLDALKWDAGQVPRVLAENGRRVASRGVREHETCARGRLGDAAASQRRAGRAGARPG